MKFIEHWLGGFRGNAFRDFMISYMYIVQKQGQITPGGTILILTERCSTLILCCKAKTI